MNAYTVFGREGWREVVLIPSHCSRGSGEWSALYLKGTKDHDGRQNPNRASRFLPDSFSRVAYLSPGLVKDSATLPL